jgi:hypothetical protein
MSTDDAISGGQVIPDEIRGLLEKRTTFQGWLDRLDDLGDQFSSEVAEKVRSDYVGRLDRVEGELAEHRTELESALSERRVAVADVTERHDARAAELEETELRYRVGEFGEAEWKDRRKAQQAALDELAAEVKEHSGAVTALEGVLDELAGRAKSDTVKARPEAEPVPLELEAEPVAVADLPQGLEVAGEESTGMEPDLPEEVQEAGISRRFDDEAPEVEELFAEASSLEDEREAISEVAVEPEAEEGPAVEEEAEPAGVQAEPDGESAEFMDELEFLESLSLDDADSFDAVSAMLDEEDDDTKSDRKSEDL